MDLKMHSRKSLFKLRDQWRYQVRIHGGQCADDKPAALCTVKFTNQLSGLFHFSERPFRMVTKEHAGLGESYRPSESIKEARAQLIL